MKFFAEVKIFQYACHELLNLLFTSFLQYRLSVDPELCFKGALQLPYFHHSMHSRCKYNTHLGLL